MNNIFFSQSTDSNRARVRSAVSRIDHDDGFTIGNARWGNRTWFCNWRKRDRDLRWGNGIWFYDGWKRDGNLGWTGGRNPK